MGKKTEFTVADAQRVRCYEKWTANGAYARHRPMTGEELRARIDQLGLRYTAVALWLGLSVDGLHKQMRGDRPVSPQTMLLFEQIEKELQFLAKLENGEADTPAQQRQLRRQDLQQVAERLRFAEKRKWLWSVEP